MINYSEQIGAVSSIITDTPDFFIKLNGTLYSVGSGNKLRKHNSGDEYNSFYSGDLPKESKIEFSVNGNAAITKVFDYISMPNEDKYSVPSYANFKTSNMTSGTASSFDSRESNASTAIPRAIGGDLFADRMRGKYLISTLSYYDKGGAKFIIPYVETTYRYSQS